MTNPVDPTTPAPPAFAQTPIPPYAEAASAPPHAQQAPVAPYAPQQGASAPSKGLAITSLVLGIVAFATAFIPIWSWVALFLGVAAVVLGVFSLIKRRGTGLAITGLIFGGVGLVLAVIASIMWAAIFSAGSGAVEHSLKSSSKGAAASAAPSAAAKPAAKENPKFGQTYKWSDGLAVTISAPAAYTPSQYASGVVPGQANVIFTITLKNGTTQPVDPAFAGGDLNSGGVAGSNIVEVAGPQGDINEYPLSSAKLLPGQSLSWKAAYSVKDPNDLTLDFAISDFLHDDAIFTK
ncbi:hypothetical protein GCM10022286_30940 [Gryllotalpicola daejeonensis]|uniref:DUF4190 domain-containing protein n=1 Tax=Gryllotalpicola daejeonensis TaxID=993087 RepID=A0ABP7ZP02_9MICO